jgi:hypothetical protein
MRRTTILIAAVALLAGVAQPANAQFNAFGQYGNMNTSLGNRGGFGWGGGTTYPALSPYLDIVRGGNPAINYYLGTLPEFERRNFQANVMSALPSLDALVTQSQQPPDINAIPMLNQTGHLSAFQAFGSYYGYGVGQRPYYPLNPSQTRMVPR